MEEADFSGDDAPGFDVFVTRGGWRAPSFGAAVDAPQHRKEECCCCYNSDCLVKSLANHDRIVGERGGSEVGVDNDKRGHNVFGERGVCLCW